MTPQRDLFSISPANTATLEWPAKNLEDRLRVELSKAREEYENNRIPDDAEFVSTYIKQILSTRRLSRFGRDRREKEDILFDFGINTVLVDALIALGINPAEAKLGYNLILGGMCMDCLQEDFESHRSSKKYRGILEQSNTVSRDGQNGYTLNDLLFRRDEILIQDYMLDEDENLRNSLLPTCDTHKAPVQVYSVHSFTLLDPSLDSSVPGAKGPLRIDMRVKGLDAVIKMANYLQSKRSDIWDELGVRVIADDKAWPRVLFHLVRTEVHNLTTEEWHGLGLIRAHWYSENEPKRAFMTPFPKYVGGEINPEYTSARELSDCIVPDNKRNPWSSNIFDSKIKFIEFVCPRGRHAGQKHLHIPIDVHFMTPEAWGRYVRSEYSHSIYKARAYANILEQWDMMDWAVFNRLAEFWVDDYQQPFAEALYKNSAYYKSTQLAH